MQAIKEEFEQQVAQHGDDVYSDPDFAPEASNLIKPENANANPSFG
jgi:hypothetical protein